ncbi:MAG TPA: hypothetical protein VGK90_07190 [Rhizomicrobium sp.]|jgi:hypothetical protein
MGALLSDRAVLKIQGSDARDFLQGLITNDIRKLTADAPLYTALLTPQGKILCDFLLYEHDGAVLLECERASLGDLKTRLSRYRLRAKVEIVSRDDLAIAWEPHGNGPEAKQDPRHPALGYRTIVPADTNSASNTAYLTHRLELGIPEGADFGSDRMFALDADLDELHGVAFDKGCYVGQELTARMKHRGTARKRLLPVESEFELPGADTPVTAPGNEIGVITSTYANRGFAAIRLDRLADADGAALHAAGVHVRVRKPEWLLS